MRMVRTGVVAGVSAVGAVGIVGGGVGTGRLFGNGGEVRAGWGWN